MGKKNSGSTLAYNLRPNKAVDRDVFIDLLTYLKSSLRLIEHRYVGLGGPFLEDFHLLGARVGIRDMVSVEYDEATFWRQHHNRPPFVSLWQGSIEDFVGEASLDNRRCIIWFDYTENNRIQSKLDTLADAARTANTNSIFKITLNASLPTASKESSESHSEWLSEKLAAGRTMLAPYASPDLSVSDIDNRTAWASALIKSLDISLSHNLTQNSGHRAIGFIPLTSALYADAAPMITATFMTCQLGMESALIEQLNLNDWDFYNPNWIEPFLIDIPALSPIERSILECKIESGANTPSGVDDLRMALYHASHNFKVPKGSIGTADDVLNSFSRFRRLFPEFARLVR